jgi:ABC-type bacteriocin/lantibiotic exporter with double-glycine peptidase domain
MTLISLCIFGVAGGLLFMVAPSAQQVPPAELETSLEQIDPKRSCGMICVTVASGFLDHPIELNRVKQVVRADGLGRCSMADLIDGLHRLGFSARRVKVQSQALQKLAGLPTILYVSQSHFVVIMPVGDGSVVVVDPPRPVECVPGSTLARRWKGEAIVVRNSPEELEIALSSLGIPDGESLGTP